MSRCVSCACCGVLFLLAGAVSTTLATEMVVTPEASTPIATADLRPTFIETTFENHKLELGSVDLNHAMSFGDDAPSPLFTTPSISGASPGADANTSEWNYLWRNASRIPITAIPEPTIGSLVIGSALLLWARLLRKPAK